MEVYENADREDGVSCGPWTGTLGVPQEAYQTYEQLANESIDAHLAEALGEVEGASEFVPLTAEWEQDAIAAEKAAGLINFQEAVKDLEGRIKEVEARQARHDEAEADALAQTKWVVVDGIITALTEALTEVMLEHDTPDWTRELIQRRFNRARRLSVSYTVGLAGTVPTAHELSYQGRGQFVLDGEVLDD